MFTVSSDLSAPLSPEVCRMLASSKLFEGIEDFAAEVMFRHKMTLLEAGGPEVRSGIVFAYCAKHAMESEEILSKCVKLFPRAQAEVAYLCCHPCPFRPTWNAAPLWVLTSRAAAAIAEAFQGLGLEREAPLIDLKEVFDDPSINTVRGFTKQGDGSAPGEGSLKPSVAQPRSSSDILWSFLRDLNTDGERVALKGSTEQVSISLEPESSCQCCTSSFGETCHTQESQASSRQYSSVPTGYMSLLGLNVIGNWCRRKSSDLSSID
jgi:hypothetical protein